nr:mitogen-activated protein kinase kinase kinase NPK1-like [Tanacetum cinerariifolium]
MMLSSNESNMKKRRLTDNENIYEAKRSKKEDYGDGAAWIRGSIIGKGRYGSVFVANTKIKYSSYPSIMAVKSAEVSVSGSIQKEKVVMDNIHGSENVIKCLGEEITIENNRINNNGFIAKIGDLGSAKRVKPVKKSNPSHNWRGNPLYFSPEAVINGVPKPAADIWAFGCIVFEMLTGEKLWLAYKDLDDDDDDGDDGYKNELCKSSCSNRSKYVLSPRLDSTTDGRLNEVRIPVGLGISK